MNKLSLAEVAQVTGAEKNSDAEIFFEGVTTDSRKLNSGCLFVALKGEIFKGAFDGVFAQKGSGGCPCQQEL